MDAHDWRAFVALAVERHRVAPQLAAAARWLDPPMPAPVRDAVFAGARADGFAALAQKRETARLLPVLAAHGIEPVLLKGWPLGEELGGSAGARHSKDIDLLVAPEERIAALDVLRGLGYRPAPEHAGRAARIAHRALAAECNDITLVDSAGWQVELHWRSLHFRGWPDIRVFDPAPRRWPIDDTGLAARVPSRPATLVYLALHGQLHAWLRLKWLDDFARALTSFGASELAEACALARKLRVTRALACAGHLARSLFGAPLPAGWPAPDARGRLLMRRFLGGIASAGADPGGLRARFDFYWSGLVTAETPAQAMGVLRYACLRPIHSRLAARPAGPGGYRTEGGGR